MAANATTLQKSGAPKRSDLQTDHVTGPSCFYITFAVEKGRIISNLLNGVNHIFDGPKNTSK